MVGLGLCRYTCSCSYLHARVLDEVEGTEEPYEPDGPEALGGISAAHEMGKRTGMDRVRKDGAGD